MRAADFCRKYKIDNAIGYEAANRVRSYLQTWEKDLPEENLVLAARGVVRDKLARMRAVVNHLEDCLDRLEGTPPRSVKKKQATTHWADHPWSSKQQARKKEAARNDAEGVPFENDPSDPRDPA